MRLRQVLDNLLANARAHTPDGTPVSVELRHGDGQATVTVADRGPGRRVPRRIEARPTPGDGATFAITLPLAPR
jgi:signal transduction histidine kinase